MYRVPKRQYCGSIGIRIRGYVPLTYRSGSGTCYFRQWPSRRQQIFLCLLLFETTFTLFFEDKSHKEVRRSRNQGFSYYFCLMIERSGSGAGSVPLTNGSGSGRPKNIRIIRLRILIRNTAKWIYSLLEDGWGGGVFLPIFPREATLIWCKGPWRQPLIDTWLPSINPSPAWRNHLYSIIRYMTLLSVKLR